MSLWDNVTSVARGVLPDALAGRPPSTLIDALARTNIERARAELRLGNQKAGDSLLRSTLGRLESMAGEVAGRPEETAKAAQYDLLRSIALSVSGQGLERLGAADEARDRYQRAVELFARVRDDQLGARDRSDYGVALAALGRPEARVYLEQAGDQDGKTPEGTRHLARLLLDSGDLAEASRMLDETLQVAPTDADAYLLLGRLQQRQGHAAAASTYQQAAYLYLQAGRPADARRALETARDLLGDQQAALGLHAEALRMEGRHKEAAAEFQQALDREPDNPWLLGRLGATEAALGNLAKARQHLVRAASLAPDDSSVLLLAGEVLLQQQDWKAAAEFGDRAARINPRSVAPYALRARAARGLGSIDQALEVLRAGRALAPQDIGLLRLHIELERESGNLAEAVELLQTLCGLDDATPPDHMQYADLLATTGRLLEAVEAAAEAERRWPDDPAVVELYGDLLRRNGQPEESVRVLRRMVELNPRSARAQVLLALSLFGLAAEDERVDAEAFDALARSIALDPGWADPYWIRAVMLVRRGDVEQAKKDIQVALDNDPDHQGALELQVELSLRAGDPATAVELVRHLLKQKPRQPRHLLLLARAHFEHKDTRRSLKVLVDMPAEVRKDQELHAQWLLLRGRVRAYLHRWDDAERDLAQVVELQPDLPDGWFYRAELARLRADARPALKYSSRALKLQRDHVKAWGTRAAALMMLGRKSEARAALEEALRLDGDYALGQRLLAQLLARDDPKRARTLLDRAIARAPSERGLRIERGWLAISTGQYEQARAEFQALLREERNPDVLAGMAEALRLLGRPEEAIEMAEQALLLVPDHIEALRSLGFSHLNRYEYKRALEYLNTIHETYPADIRAKADLGYASVYTEDMERALTLLNEACVASPQDPWFLRQLGRVLNDVAAFDDAARLLRRSSDLYAGDPITWQALAWALKSLDPPQAVEAKRAWERCAELDPEEPWWQRGIADVLHTMGEKQAAAHLYGTVRKRAEAMRSERTDMLSLIGWCAFRLGDFPTAARCFSEAGSLEPVPGSDLFDLALVMLCQGRLDRGLAQYEAAIELARGRHGLLTRGLVVVARIDLGQAMRDHPHLRKATQAGTVAELLESTLGQLPIPPKLEAVQQNPG